MICDDDMNGFMTTIKGMSDRDKGLNLIIHTPGGFISSVEQIVQYLKKKFNNNIYVYVPHVAYSGGTLMAIASKKIFMGDHSNLGPVDPQTENGSAFDIVTEIRKAKEEIENDEKKALFWQPIIAKYNIGLVERCNKSILRVRELVKSYLISNMFSEEQNSDIIDNIIVELVDNALKNEHSQPFNVDKCRSMGLKVGGLEEEPLLQDAILSLHHCYTITFQNTPALKIIENDIDQSYIKIQTQFVQIPSQLKEPPDKK